MISIQEIVVQLIIFSAVGYTLYHTVKLFVPAGKKQHAHHCSGCNGCLLKEMKEPQHVSGRKLIYSKFDQK